MLSFAFFVAGIFDQIQENLAEFFAEEPEISLVFIGVVFLGIPISLWIVYNGIDKTWPSITDLRHNHSVGGVRFAIRRCSMGSLAGGAMVLLIGLEITVMSIILFLLSVEERFGYPVRSWLF